MLLQILQKANDFSCSSSSHVPHYSYAWSGPTSSQRCKITPFFLQKNTLCNIFCRDFFSRPPYQYQRYKYGHPYLTYLPQKILSKLFFRKKFGSKVPYLPTVWTYVQNFVVFFFWTLSLWRT